MNFFRISLLCALPLALAACESSQVRTYDAPKDPRPAPPAPTQTMMASPEIPRWTVPAGWEELAGEGMRFATLRPVPGDGTLEVRVTPLGKIAADPLSNANRWAGQIGLEALDEAALAQVSRSVQAGDRTAFYVDLKGPATDDGPGQRILGAILDGDERTWFFMLPGQTDLVEPHAKAFEEFIASVRLEGGAGSLPAGHPEVASGSGTGGGPGAPSGGAGEEALTYELPGGWKLIASEAQFRVLTLQAGEAVVAVTKFPGSVGGMLMNINRWRGQVGLPEISDLSQQAVEHRHVAGGEAQQIDLAGPEGRSMSVYIVPRARMTWFLKLDGRTEQIEAQRAAFDAFMASVGFQG